jgi:hypothetical protein
MVELTLAKSLVALVLLEWAFLLQVDVWQSYGEWYEVKYSL